MTAHKSWRKRITSLLATGTTALLVAGGLVLVPAAAQAAPGTVANATLEWGVKASFRNYIYNFAMFEGKTTLLGNTAQPVAKGAYNWSGGVGSAESEGASADVSFGEGNGVHFQSHPMDVDGETAYALDIQFTNPRVVVTSASTGELHMDVVGHEFVDVTTVGAQYTMDDVTLATLALPAPTAAEDTLTWSGATATLTANGSKAFGGFYQTGDALDPLTFSLPVAETVAADTTTTVQTPSAQVFAGSKTTLSATVAPAVDGTVQFFNGATALGEAVAVSGGTASLETSSLVVGSNSITATFTPADAAAYNSSTSAAVNVVAEGSGVSVFLADGVTPAGSSDLVAGDKVVVQGSGFDPAANVGGRGVPIPANLPQGVYVVFGEFADNWKPSAGVASSARAASSQKWATTADTLSKIPPAFKSAVEAQWVELNLDGSFEAELTLANPSATVADGNFGIYTYPAGGIKNAAQEQAVLLNYQTVTTTSALTLSGTQVELGTSVALTTTVTPAATGKVQYFTGATDKTVTTPIGSPVTVVDGVAVLNTDALPTGSTFIKSKFTPTDPEAFSASETAVKSVQVSTKATSTTLSVSPSKVEFGDEVTLTATVTPAAALGTVSFYSDGVKIGDTKFYAGAPIDLKTSELSAGEHSLTVSFIPADATQYSASEATAKTVTVDAAATKTTLSVSAPEAEFGKAVKLTADVAPAATGSVQFFAGSIAVGDAVAVANGVASISTTALVAGENNVTAVFTSTDSNYLGSESNVKLVEVTARKTATSLTASASSLVIGKELTLTATVTPAADGTVAFFDGDVQVGSEVAVASGAASTVLLDAGLGEHRYTAEFTPANAAQYKSSVSDATEVEITPVVPTVVINDGNASALKPGDSVVFTGGPFEPGQSVGVVINSDPIDLGSFTANAEGFVNVEWTVPVGFAAGAHEVVFTPEGGEPVAAAFSVAAVDAGNGGNTGDGGTTGGGSVTNPTAAKGLASTGAQDGAWLAAAAALALLVGAGLIVARRRVTSD